MLAVLLISPASARSAGVPPGQSFACKFVAGRPPVRCAHLLRKHAPGPIRRTSLEKEFTKLAASGFLPFLAQADPTGPITTFLTFLTQIFLIIGGILIAYGGYEISRGRVVEGLLCILGGLLLALAIPVMKWLQHVASGGA